jgi:hypothetical protein
MPAKTSDTGLKRFAFDVNHLNRFSSCFDALFGPKTVSHFSESALAKQIVETLKSLQQANALK